MANFEYDLNDQDYQLVASQVDRQLFSGTNDYIRIIVRPTESMTQIVTLANNNQAIFYSSLNPTRFNINVSPFGAGLSNLRLQQSVALLALSGPPAVQKLTSGYSEAHK